MHKLSIAEPPAATFQGLRVLCEEEIASFLQSCARPISCTSEDDFYFYTWPGNRKQNGDISHDHRMWLVDHDERRNMACGAMTIEAPEQPQGPLRVGYIHVFSAHRGEQRGQKMLRSALHFAGLAGHAVDLGWFLTEGEKYIFPALPQMLRDIPVSVQLEYGRPSMFTQLRDMEQEFGDRVRVRGAGYLHAKNVLSL